MVVTIGSAGGETGEPGWAFRKFALDEVAMTAHPPPVPPTQRTDKGPDQPQASATPKQPADSKSPIQRLIDSAP